MAEATQASKLPDRLVSYAQNWEDLNLYWLSGHKEKGFYVDVGASDPVHFSVTKFLYDMGWRGINIEPITHLHRKEVQQRPRDINLNLGVADKPGQLTLREYLDADGLSTFDEVEKKNIGNTFKYRDTKIHMETLQTVLEQHLPPKTTIDFMKVDVEGFEYEVLAGNDWQAFRPRIICIEANHVHKDWRKLLERQDYELIFFDGLNEYWTTDAKEVSKSFGDFADLFLSGRIVEQQTNLEHRAKETNELQLLRTTASHQQSLLNEYQTQIAKLHWHINFLEHLSIKSSLKQLLKAIYRSLKFRIAKLIWGSSGYKNTPAITAQKNETIKGQAAAEAFVQALNASDAENVGIVARKGRVRSLLYESIRRLEVKLRSLVTRK